MKKGVIILFGVLFLFVLNMIFVSAEMLVSDAGVKYESEIFEEFNTSEWVEVIVRIKDSSNIAIEGTKEEKINLMRQRDEMLGLVTEQVISSISEEELILVLDRKPDEKFIAEITREGFDKLINDTRIDALYKDKTTHTALDENELIKVSEGDSEGIEQDKNKKSGIYNLFDIFIQFFKSLFGK